MTTLVNEVWTLLEKEYEAYNKQNKNFTANLTDEKKQAFHDLCDNKYDYIMKKYMDPSVMFLDRHKVAAIIIISLLELDIIHYENMDNDYVFIGAEVVALKVGLAYMVEKLNEKLKDRGVQKRVEMFEFPNAQSCKTPYMEIICRNLYYCKTDYVFNPLDLSDRLFLVEYIALMKMGIDPDILKDY